MILTYVAQHGSIVRAQAAELSRIARDEASRRLPA